MWFNGFSLRAVPRADATPGSPAHRPPAGQGAVSTLSLSGPGQPIRVIP